MLPHEAEESARRIGVFGSWRSSCRRSPPRPFAACIREREPLDELLETTVRDLAFLPRLALTLLLTGLLGWERELKERPAGLRTHMLVGISACSFVLLGELFIERFGHADGGGLNFDPIRIIEATVAGVSFLGAGTIFVRGSRHVYGLTTAGSLLAAAAVAMMVAVERYALATVVTLLILLVVAGLQRLEARAHAASDAARSESNPPQPDGETPAAPRE